MQRILRSSLRSINDTLFCRTMNHNNGSAPFSRVLEYKSTDPLDRRRWIGWTTGYSDPKPHPGSAAAKWLASTATELDWSLVPQVCFDRQTAIRVAALVRKLRRDAGFQVLSGRVHRGSRPFVSIRAILPSGEVRLYRSIRSCGRDLGVGRNVVSRQIARNLPIMTDFGVVRASKV